jgi:flagellar motor switch protein FliG
MAKKDTKIDGMDAVARILNAMGPHAEERVFSEIQDQAPNMAEDIRSRMFMFRDIETLDDRSIRELLKEVADDELTLALRGAEQRLRDKVFGNLSQRAAAMLRDDLEAMGPVRLAEVEAAQRNVAGVARKLEAQGRIVIAKESGDTLV